jgi:hypothetical protein
VQGAKFPELVSGRMAEMAYEIVSEDHVWRRDYSLYYHVDDAKVRGLAWDANASFDLMIRGAFFPQPAPELLGRASPKDAQLCLQMLGSKSVVPSGKESSIITRTGSTLPDTAIVFKYVPPEPPPPDDYEAFLQDILALIPSAGPIPTDGPYTKQRESLQKLVYGKTLAFLLKAREHAYLRFTSSFENRKNVQMACRWMQAAISIRERAETAKRELARATAQGALRKVDTLTRAELANEAIKRFNAFYAIEEENNRKEAFDDFLSVLSEFILRFPPLSNETNYPGLTNQWKKEYDRIRDAVRDGAVYTKPTLSQKELRYVPRVPGDYEYSLMGDDFNNQNVMDMLVEKKIISGWHSDYRLYISLWRGDVPDLKPRDVETVISASFHRQLDKTGDDEDLLQLSTKKYNPEVDSGPLAWVQSAVKMFRSFVVGDKRNLEELDQTEFREETIEKACKSNIKRIIKSAAEALVQKDAASAAKLTGEMDHLLGLVLKAWGKVELLATTKDSEGNRVVDDTIIKEKKILLRDTMIDIVDAYNVLRFAFSKKDRYISVTYPAEVTKIIYDGSLKR